MLVLLLTLIFGNNARFIKTLQFLGVVLVLAKFKVFGNFDLSEYQHKDLTVKRYDINFKSRLGKLEKLTETDFNRKSSIDPKRIYQCYSILANCMLYLC